MGLLVKTLELQDFRSFGEKVVGLAPATTILCGPNAAGKTNTVEALQLLTAGYSFRHPTPAQLVREGAQAARASARLEGDGRVVDLRCDVVSGRRQFFRNGKRVQASEVSGTLMSVLFTPDDLQLVKRSASFRRDELDDFGRQANRGFASVLATYTRSIEQRNRLLKEERPDLDLLDAWDASVALGGATLLHGACASSSGFVPRSARSTASWPRGSGLSAAMSAAWGTRLWASPRTTCASSSASGWLPPVRMTCAVSRPPWARTATTWRFSSRDATRGPTAARGSSAPLCWRSRWPRSFSPRRWWVTSHCCSWTTS